MASTTNLLLILCPILVAMTEGAAVSIGDGQSGVVNRPTRAGPDCERLLTSEHDDVIVMSNSSADQDYTYVLRPQGSASLYKLWFDDVRLNPGDFIEARETPQQDPAGRSLGPSSHGPFVLFKGEMYVRVRVGNDSGHSARMHWAPITVETVTSLTCTDDAMKIRVNVTELRWLYNDTDPDHISLMDESCTGSTNGDTWAMENSHSQCYTQREIDDNFIQYRNALIYKEPGSGPIVREHRWRVDLKCNFRRQMQVVTNYELRKLTTYEVHLKADYKAEMHLYNDSSLQHELSRDHEIRVGLADDLYVKVDLTGDWNVSMHLQSCVARPLPASLTAYTLIQNGCPEDSQTFIVYAKHNSTMFHFKAFEFYEGSSSVYIDCEVTYCAPFDNGPRCGAVCH